MASLEQAKPMAFCYPRKGIQRRNSHPRAQVFSALGPPFLYTVPDLPGTRSNEWAVG